ncbi:MAG: hypothetical protein ACYDA3_09165 [Gaiellaceae bacterium]
MKNWTTRGRIAAVFGGLAVCAPGAAWGGTAPDGRGVVAARLVPSSVPAPAALISAPRVQPDNAELHVRDGALGRQSLRQARTHITVAGTLSDTTSLFEGLSYNESGADPPDVTIAAGAGDIVEMTNVTRRVWSAGGSVLQSVTALYQMFGTDNDLLSDPRVVFDVQSGHWFASVMDFSRGVVVVAASTTSNPLDSWNTWSLKINGSSACFDQPKLGSSDALIVVTAAAYNRRGALCSFADFSYAGGVIWALSKQELLSGAAARWASWGPNTDFNVPVAAQGMSGATTAYAASSFSSSIEVFAINGTPPTSSLTATTVGTASWTDPPAAVQPLNAILLATDDDRLLDAFWSDGELWVGGNARCSQSDGVDHACARVVEISTALNTVGVDTALAQPGGDTYYPALRPDGSGNVAIGYGVSSTTLFPSIAVVVYRSDGTWSPSQIVKAGTVALQLPRYGDYFGAARDPTLPNVVWIGGEYIGGALGYQTAVAAVRTVVLAPTVDYASPGAGALTRQSATLSGYVDPRGSDATYWFEYGKSTLYGHVTAQTAAAASAGRQQVSAVLAGLAAGTAYHWRLDSSNAAGTTDGADQAFRTAPPAKKKPKKR